MIIGIDMGHSLSGAGTGAAGIYKEVVKNREVGKRLIAMLKEKGHTVVNCTVDSANSQSAQLAGIVNKANSQRLDLFVSLHLNSFNGAAYGVETFIYNGSWASKETLRAKAKKINDGLATDIGWYNRGVKEASYYVLRKTIAPAILIELGFCDSKRDMDLWNTEKIAASLFRTITGAAYVGAATTPSTSFKVKVKADVLNVRAGAGTKYKVNTTVKRNEVYTIVATDGKWGKLKSGAGWLHLDYTERV